MILQQISLIFSQSRTTHNCRYLVRNVYITFYCFTYKPRHSEGVPAYQKTNFLNQGSRKVDNKHDRQTERQM